MRATRQATQFQLPPDRFVFFDVPGLPRGQPRIRIGRAGKFARAFKSKEAVEMETTFRALATPCAPPVPYTGPVWLDMTCRFPIPLGWPKWKQKAAQDGAIYPTTKPDADNCAKLVKDALTDLFWVDDKQVVTLTVRKRYTEGQPRTSIVVRELEERKNVRSHAQGGGDSTGPAIP